MVNLQKVGGQFVEEGYVLTPSDRTKVDSLKPVATSGSYNDLTDKPTIQTLQIATPTVLGGIKPDNTTITVNSSTGVASATIPNASLTVAGKVQLVNSLTSSSNAFAATANSVKTLNDLKAEREQEPWKDGTLLNQWTGTFKYYMDEFKNVHVYIDATAGNKLKETIIAALPTGYQVVTPGIEFPILGHSRSASNQYSIEVLKTSSTNANLVLDKDVTNDRVKFYGQFRTS